MAEIKLDNSRAQIEDGTYEWPPRYSETIKEAREAEEKLTLALGHCHLRLV